MQIVRLIGLNKFVIFEVFFWMGNILGVIVYFVIFLVILRYEYLEVIFVIRLDESKFRFDDNEFVFLYQSYVFIVVILVI